METGLFREKIEPYFLERETPYAKRRPLKTQNIRRVVFVISVLFFVGALYFGGKGEKRTVDSTKLEYSPISPRSTPASTGGGIQASPLDGYRSAYRGEDRSIGYSRSGSTSTRSRNAAQVVRRGEGASDPAARLPMGFGIPVTLVNDVLSSDSATPVVAEVTQDVFSPGQNSSEVSIPMGTRAIGNANYDSSNSRIQVRFHTFVFPEGEQHGLQGVGLMSNGSAGLVGEYHSGELARRTGGFIGNFVGGMAEGMKEKQSGGMGGAFEPGSVRNGVLNGLAQSASETTKSYSDSLSQTKPTMTLQAGQSFVIFLEHEFTP